MSTAAVALRSLSGLASDLHAPVPTILATIRRLGIQPSMTIDTTPFFDGPAVDLIAAEIATVADKGSRSFRDGITTKAEAQ